MLQKTDPGFRIISLFFNRKRMALALFGLITAAAALDIAVPFLTQQLIDALVKDFKSPGGHAVRILVTSAGGILAATVFARVIRSVYNYQLFRTVTRKSS